MSWINRDQKNSVRIQRGWLWMLAAMMSAFMSSNSMAAIFVVNSNGDVNDAVTDGDCDTGNTIPDGAGGLAVECTLRAAINEAEATPDRDQIHFSNDLLYGSRGTATIDLGSALPAIDQPVDIDGRTAPSWVADGYPRVRLLGNGTVGGFDGIRLRAGAADSSIKGLAFQNFQYAVVMMGADEAQVDACAFGYWVEPSTGVPPFITPSESLSGSINGIRVESGSRGSILGMRVVSAIFGTFEFSGQGNTIAGNDWGIVNHANDTSIVGNTIGTNIDGTRIEGQFLVSPPRVSDRSTWATITGFGRRTPRDSKLEGSSIPWLPWGSQRVISSRITSTAFTSMRTSSTVGCPLKLSATRSERTSMARSISETRITEFG